MQEILDGLDSDADPPYIPQPWEESSNDSTESMFSSKNRGKKHNMRSIEEANSHHLPRPTVLSFEVKYCLCSLKTLKEFQFICAHCTYVANK